MPHVIDLTGKTALVTGGSRGIGAAIVRTLSAAGARCAVNYVDDPAGKNAADAAEVVASLNGSIAIQADVSDPAQVNQMIDDCIAQLGQLDIVINNAGILRDSSLKRTTDDLWQSILAVNLTGVFNVLRAITGKIRPGGRIVNLSSVTAYLGFFGQANYASSKAGVVALTKVAAREFAKTQITVNSIAPGFIDTDMTRDTPQDVMNKFLEQVPLARKGTPDDIANVALFLCSPLAAYLTGQIIHVDGGFFMAG